MDTLLTIGEISRRSGVAASALHFYEERELIACTRVGSGHAIRGQSRCGRIV
jgi:MerR family redox-sensitive transcriptional activator SoxR